MKKVGQTEGATSLMKYKEEFETVCSIIATHRKRVIRVVNNESMSMVWEVGGYVSHKLKTSVWGDGVVRQLSDYIRTKYPAARGWSYRTLYKMVQLYDTYATASFSALIEKTDMTKYGDIVPFETAQIDGKLIVPFEMAQIANDVIVPIELAQIPQVLFATGWSNHQLIMSRCKSDEQRLFYMLYAGREQLEYKELQRAIKTDAMSSILGSKDVQSEMMKREYPQSGVLFKDTVYLEMFGLPVKYKESKLRKEIIAHMKDLSSRSLQLSEAIRRIQISSEKWDE